MSVNVVPSTAPEADTKVFAKFNVKSLFWLVTPVLLKRMGRKYLRSVQMSRKGRADLSLGITQDHFPTIAEERVAISINQKRKYLQYE